MESQEQFVKDVFMAVDNMDADGFARFFTAQGAFAFGNGAAVIGRENIVSAVNGFFGAIQAMKHTVTGLWTEGDVMIVRALITYTRKDGNIVEVPCCNVWKIAGREITEYQIFMDVSPVFA